MEQPKRLEAAVPSPVEGTISTEEAPTPAVQEDHIPKAHQRPAQENPHTPPPAAVQEDHIPEAQQRPARETPHDVCQDMRKTRDARIAREEIPRGEEKEVPDLGGDQVAGLDRYVKATGDGQGVQAAKSSCVQVPGRESHVEAPDWVQVTKPSCAEKFLD